ncbi:Protein of unknown function [Alkalibacterium putridalgicola]|uniref:Membrane protein n=1 Tax=Alkalibacterium putridalgicola TaxID=426703 RepID=A0A1H7RB02_9LACT|nr:DUF975 family protein [Alkalibacterium putridalgicola]GEK88838.1 membrane protein [Alkalibacterium putridalgicola]SEL57148.1 Protein of unknown function [Alkalibacterium putridalgicola]
MSIAMIKGMAKQMMKGKRLLLTVGYILALTAWAIAAQILTGLFRLPSLFDFTEAALEGRLGLNMTTLLFPVLLILLFILADMLHVSYRWFGLDVMDEKTEEPKMVFQGFHRDKIKRLMSLVLLRFVIVAGWSLLLILPGIWKAYLYSQAANIMKTDGKVTAMEALKQSEEVMEGNEWKYAALQLTFAPWYLIPAGLFAYFIGSNLFEIETGFETGAESAELIYGLLVAVFFMTLLIVFLFSIYVEPFKMMSKQVFYTELVNHTREETYDDYEEVLLKRQGLDSSKNTKRNQKRTKR